MPKLTDVAVKQILARERPFTLSDGAGLSLLIKPNGTKAWRYNYRFGGKQKTLALGVYPDVSLKVARDGLAKARAELKQGVDPSGEKQRRKRQSAFDAGNSFESVAKEWWSNQKGKWTEGHAHRVWRRLHDNALPALGHRTINQIDPPDVKAVIRKIEKRGSLDVAQRVLQAIRAIFRFAVQEGRIKTNPIVDLTAEILQSRTPEHRPSLSRNEFPEFLQALGKYHFQGRLLTQLAIQLLVLTFVRPGELRGARWEEFDVEEKLWRVPGHRMKMKTDHIVPLSIQSIKTIDQIQLISGEGDLLFPSERDRHECMSDNTMRRAIFKLGYDGNTPGKSKCVPHGFRATASSILNESGWNPDAIERQLSHMERDGVRAAYTHHARYLDEREKMMQWWADYLDGLKEEGGSNKIIAGNFKGKQKAS